MLRAMLVLLPLLLGTRVGILRASLLRASIPVKVTVGTVLSGRMITTTDAHNLMVLRDGRLSIILLGSGWISIQEVSDSSVE
jgi:hypothetical protein